MRQLFFLTIYSGIAIALSSTATFPQPSHASSTSFRCDTSNRQATTIADVVLSNGTPEPANLFYWSKAFPSEPGRARQLCREVSNRLQSYARSHQDIRLKAERVDNQFVVCFVGNDDEGCTARSQRLFTLNPREAERVRNTLFDNSVRARLGQSIGQTYGNRRIFIFW
jgi:Circadian oscillating protein COP23